MGTKESEEKGQSEETEQEVVASAEEKPQSEEKSSSESESNNGKNDRSNADEALSMTATAYTANCNGCSGVTATGIDLNDNPNMKVVAVDPGVIPLSSELWVEGYGVAITGDTVGGINGDGSDLHVTCNGEENDFGSQEVKVKVIH